MTLPYLCKDNSSSREHEGSFLPSSRTQSPFFLFIACKGFRQAATHDHPFGRLAKFARVLLFRPRLQTGDSDTKHMFTCSAFPFCTSEVDGYKPSPSLVSASPSYQPTRRYPTPRNATFKIIFPRPNHLQNPAHLLLETSSACPVCSGHKHKHTSSSKVLQKQLR